MSFRNVVRNHRRSLITGAAVMFAVFFASSMRCLQEGAWGYLVGNLVGVHFGYMQIQHPDYQKTPSLDNALLLEDLKIVQEDLDVQLFPRTQNFALSSHGDKSKAILCIGIEAKQEKEWQAVNKKIVEGDGKLSSGEILIASGVRKSLDVAIGDTIVLLSQGRFGANAVGQYKLSGIIEFGSPEFNNQFAYINIKDADLLFDMQGHVSYAVVDVADEAEMVEVKSSILSKLKDGLVLRDYKELLPGIMQAKEFDKLSGKVIISVLYLLIGFGVFGTIIMMLKERTYEFGILKAIGMKSAELYAVILLESIFIAIIGAAAGIVLAIPIIYYFQVNPIEFTGEYAEVYQNFGLEAKLPFKLDFGILLLQGLYMAVITVLLSLYGLIKIIQLKAVKAMRG